MVKVSSTPPDATNEIVIGPHRGSFEPPCVLHLHLIGDVELAHAQAIAKIIDKLAASRGIYLLRDARKAGIITSAARAHILARTRPGAILATVSYGASFRGRIVLSLLTRAIRTFKKTAPIVIFTDTEAEARAWIEAHQAGYATQQQSSYF